jgi:hypothetical protein
VIDLTTDKSKGKGEIILSSLNKSMLTRRLVNLIFRKATQLLKLKLIFCESKDEKLLIEINFRNQCLFILLQKAASNFALVIISDHSKTKIVTSTSGKEDRAKTMLRLL